MNKVFEQFGGLIKDIKETAENSYLIGSLQMMQANYTIKFGRALNEIAAMPISAKLAFAVALRELVGEFHLTLKCEDAEKDADLFTVHFYSPNADVLPSDKCLKNGPGYATDAKGRLAEDAVESVLEEIIHHYISVKAKTNSIK